MLQAFAAAGIGCPEWIAEGEDQNGRAFLLVRELEEVSDLRLHLRERLATHPRARRRFALRLGSALARLHQAGFDHPDLYAKHILVDRDGQGIHFLDLQRSRRRQRVPWGQRWTDLPGGVRGMLRYGKLTFAARENVRPGPEAEVVVGRE